MGMARALGGLAAAMVLLPAAASAHVARHVYAGTMRTTAGDSMPHAFVIETRGNKITRITMQWGQSCNSGYSIVFHGSLRNAGKPRSGGPGSIVVGRSKLFAGPIAKRGRFKAVVYGSIDVGSTEVLANARTTITGVLKARGGSGTARATTVIAPVLTGPPQDGFQPDACDSGALRWSVARGPSVFGGATAQGEPIVVRVAGRMVKDIRIGWRADGCSGPGTWWDVADEVTDFDLSSQGLFGDSFTYSEDEQDGGKTVYGYDVHGHLAGKSMTGTFGVSPLVMDAAGQPVGGCSTPSIAWKALSA
jgi:hypothetical protein